MPQDADTITLALILTAAGATAAAGLVSGIVEMLKGLTKGLAGHERLVAFVLSGALVIVAVAAGVQDGSITLSIPSIFAAFLAWYGIARLSMAVYADVAQEPNSLTGPAA